MFLAHLSIGLAQDGGALGPSSPSTLLHKDKVVGGLVLQGVHLTRPHCDETPRVDGHAGREAVHGHRVTSDLLLEQVVSKLYVLPKENKL